jgi:hypothetical protein
MMLQQAKDFVNISPSEISELAIGAEQEIGDFNDRGETPVISLMLCAPDVLEYAPFILTICSEYINLEKQQNIIPLEERYGA